MDKKLVNIDFYGQDLIATKDTKGNIWVAMKPICENIGIDWNGQLQRIKRDSVLSEGITVIHIPSKGGEQQTVCLNLKLINGWLFGIDDSRVREEIRPMVIKYKTEVYDVLYDYFHKGVAVNQQLPDIESILESTLKTIREQNLVIKQKEHIIEQKEQVISETEAFIEDNIDPSRTYSLKTAAIVFNSNTKINRRGSSTQKWTPVYIGDRILTDFLKDEKYLIYEDSFITIKGEEIRKPILVPSHDYIKHFVIRPISAKDKQTGKYSTWQNKPDLNYNGLRWLYRVIKSDKFKSYLYKRYLYQEIEFKYNPKLIIPKELGEVA